MDSLIATWAQREFNYSGRQQEFNYKFGSNLGRLGSGRGSNDHWVDCEVTHQPGGQVDTLLTIR